MSSNGSIAQHSRLPWKFIEGDDEHGNLIIVADESHQYVIGNLEGSCPTCHANGELIVSAVNATVLAQPPHADLPAYEDLLYLLHDARVAMLRFGNEMNWPPETPPEYADIMNQIRDIDALRAAAAGGRDQ